MKSFNWIVLLSWIALVLALPGTTATELPAQVDPHPEYVVLISIDGLAASYLDDHRASLPTLRMLMKRGAAAKGMITTFPSVTWPSHVSLITGTTPRKHGVIGNVVFNREKQRTVVYIGDGELTKDQAIRVPTLYDLAHKKGLKTASIIWPCCNNAKTLDWMIPDSNQQAMHDKYTTPGLANELAKEGIDITPLGKWGWKLEYSIARDELYSKVACHLLEKHRPNLLLVHFITPDGVEHAYGPHTPKAYEAVAQSDQRVKEIWDSLQKPPFAGKSALFVVSDHGFAHYEKIIQPNVVLKELGLIETNEQGKATQKHAWCVNEGGCAFVYFLDDVHKKELLAKIKTALAKVEGIHSILEPEQFVKLGLPHPDDNPEMGHLVLTTGPGYSFGDSFIGKSIVSAGGYKGTHGHLAQPDYMHATFIAAGAGIKSGVTVRTVDNIDVAPTIARLLRLKMETAEGKVLTQILEP